MVFLVYLSEENNRYQSLKILNKNIFFSSKSHNCFSSCHCDCRNCFYSCLCNFNNEKKKKRNYVIFTQFGDTKQANDGM